jgi:galactose mutarotase-like enzyme
VYDNESKKLLPLLWNNGNETLPFEGAWKNHATILFPIVGGLKNGASKTATGETIKLQGNHGFARHTEFELVASETVDSAKAIYRIGASAETKAAYPYDFELTLIYELKDDSLSLTFQIQNHDKKKMPCQFGWHPGFSTELGLGGKRADWTISVPEGLYRQFLVLDTGDSFLTGETKEHLFNGAIPLDDHALYCTLMYDIAKAANRRVRMYNSKLMRGVEVLFHDFPQIGFWANKGQEYLCIEPWQGVDDHEVQEPFDKKVGMLLLETGEKISRSAKIVPIFNRFIRLYR